MNKTVIQTRRLAPGDQFRWINTDMKIKHGLGLFKFISHMPDKSIAFWRNDDIIIEPKEQRVLKVGGLFGTTSIKVGGVI
jgi:hypothetical protein